MVGEEKMKTGGLVIIMLSITIILLGVLIFRTGDLTIGITGEVISTPTEAILEEQDLQEYTEQDCKELAFEIEDKYENCLKTGLKELWGYEDNLDCVNDFENYEDICRGKRYASESLLSESCRLNFPFIWEVYAECLTYLD